MAKAPRSTLCIPCVHALLPDKSKATYLILFNKLKELDMSGPTVAHMDYETAVYYSMKKTFPQTWTRMLWAISYVPPQDVVDVFKFIIK